MTTTNISTQNLIIGFGKAGKTLAATLSQRGEPTILVEASEQMYGGTCINVGCIPSKKLIHEAAHSDYPTAMLAKQALVSTLRQANHDKLVGLPQVQLITAQARFISADTVALSTGQQVQAERIFINTGASPVMPDVAGVDGSRIYDSAGLLSLDALPSRLVIIGAGFIALEFAFMYARYGSQVTMVSRGDVFLPHEDDDVRALMLQLLAEQGIMLRLGEQLRRFDEHDRHTTVITDVGALDADAVLIAIGRRANTAGLGLEHTDVTLDERGCIVCDERLRAGAHIWAMGDVAGSVQFTYVSLDDYRIIIDSLYGGGARHRGDRIVLPTTVFCEPPLSQIGMTEKSARATGKNIKVATLSAAAIPKARLIGRTQGLLKAIIDADTRQILGVTLFCDSSHELINLFKIAIDHGVTADYFTKQIFNHPTISEGLNDLFAQF